MSLKKLLLSKSDSDSETLDKKKASFNKKHKLKSILIHNPITQTNRTEVRVTKKVAKENAISYEEYLEILQKPHVFIIKLNSSGCCPSRRDKYVGFELTNLTGFTLLKGKFTIDSVRIFDNRNRLFMMLNYSSNQGMDGEAVVSVPNSSIPLSTIRKLPTYLPFNKRYQMTSEHFPELNCHVEQQSIENRYRRGSFFKYTICSGRKVVAKLLQPSSTDHMYVLVDENVSVFQKSGLLATAIFIAQRLKRNTKKWICIGLIFSLVFLLGFYIVASTVFNLKYKNPELHSPKFPVKLKSAED